MQMQAPTQIAYPAAIAVLVDTLPVERQMQVYEYILFIHSRLQLSPALQIQVEVDEAQWEAHV